MSYLESSEGVVITRARALQELRKHGVCDPLDFDDFDACLGIRQTYRAHEVLFWLGY